MNSLCVEIASMLDVYVRDYIKKVSDKHDVSESELLNEWDEYSKTKESKTVEKPIVVKTVKPVKDSSEKVGGCPYVFSKGEKSGKMCGTKSKDGSLYCSMHKKHEDKEPKSVKLPEPKSKSDVSSSGHLFIKNFNANIFTVTYKIAE